MLAFLTARAMWTLVRDAALDPTAGALRPGPCLVTDVLDDGSLRLRQCDSSVPGRERTFVVRLLGVRPWGVEETPAAAAWLREAAVERPATLAFDRRRFDARGAWLAYVDVGETNLNEAWVAAGWARADANPSDSAPRSRAVRRAEEGARRAGRGAWGRPTPILVAPRARG